MNKYIGIIFLVLGVVGGFVFMNQVKPAPVVVEDINASDLKDEVKEEDTVAGKLPSGSAPTTPASSIISQKWIWDKTVMSDDKVITANKPGVFSITLNTDGNVAGTTDCNGFFASYAVGSDGVIKFDQMGSTMMFCEGSQESLFMSDIARANRYMLDSSGNLVLLLPYDSGSIMFKK